MLAVTPRACESGRPDLNGHPRAGDPVLCRLSDVRVIRPAGFEPASTATARRRSSPELRAFVEEPPAGVGPAPQPYEGCVLPLTTEAWKWRRQESNLHSLGASEVLSAVELRPRRSANGWSRTTTARGYGVTSRGARRCSAFAGRATDRIRTGTARITTSNAAATPRSPGRRRGRPDSNRRRLGRQPSALAGLSYVPSFEPVSQ